MNGSVRPIPAVDVTFFNPHDAELNLYKGSDLFQNPKILQSLMAFHGKSKSGLIVTVHNGQRQCFLKENETEFPNFLLSTVTEPTMRDQLYRRTNSKRDMSCEYSRRDSSVQVTDGRYASTYQISHCHVFPTSPSEELTEFPLQQKLVNSGDSHFKIGTDRKNSSKTSKPLRTESHNVMDDMPRIQLTDNFLSSLRKYSKSTPTENLEITAKNRTKNHVKSFTKNVSSLTNKTEQLSLEKHSQCNNYIRSREPKKSELSKWLLKDRVNHGTKPSFTTAIGVIGLKKSTKQEKESLRSVTLPNIFFSVDLLDTLQEEMEANTRVANTSFPEVNAKYVQILQDTQLMEQKEGKKGERRQKFKLKLTKHQTQIKKI